MAEGCSVVRLQDRQHHLADHCGRTVHVLQQVVPRFVLFDGEIHGHAPQEAAEALWIDGKLSHSVDHRHENGICRSTCS